VDVDVGAVDVDAVDVGTWMPWTWVLAGGALLVGRSFLDGRRKIIRSQPQRSSNEEELRTAARMRSTFASL
jgi:hypothetical protein